MGPAHDPWVEKGLENVPKCVWKIDLGTWRPGSGSKLRSESIGDAPDPKNPDFRGRRHGRSLKIHVRTKRGEDEDGCVGGALHNREVIKEFINFPSVISMCKSILLLALLYHMKLNEIKGT